MSERTLRIFTAALETETNTFSPLATGWESFGRMGIMRGRDGTIVDAYHTGPLLAWRAAAQASGYTVIESIAASAEPAGRVLQHVYEALRDELLADVRAALPLDVVLLNLHGAMAATHEDDCEGDILRRIRAIVGPETIVGAELDLHCHITEAMTSNADAIVAYKEYPHDDIVEMARELYTLCIDAAHGKVKPVTAVYDCGIIGIWPTTREPMRAFVQRLRDSQRDGILSVSLGHGFPWGDVADVGAKMLVIADGDQTRAAALAAELGAAFYAMREEARYPAMSIDDALDIAIAARGTVVLADGADNAGGGAPADSTFVLRRILERGIRDVASGIYYDPMAVALCIEAGAGSLLDLRIGGKLGPTSGAPLDVRAQVRAVLHEHQQTSLIANQAIGPSAWIEVDGVDIVLVSVRTQTFAPDAFTGLGIDLRTKRIIVVKSTQHFYRNFAPLAEQTLYLAAPGALRFDMENIPYTKRDTAYWPRLLQPA